VGVELGVVPIQISEFEHGGNESGQCGVIPYDDSVVDEAVRVVLWAITLEMTSLWPWRTSPL